MTDARAEIVDRIRRATGPSSRPCADDYAAIPREYRQTGALGVVERLDLFVNRLEHYDARVYRCVPEALATTIARGLDARDKHQIVVPADLPREWLPAGVGVAADVDLDYGELDRAPAVLTGCTVAIALTGTIVLRHAVAEGRRAVTLIPDYHLCVVRTDQVVETVAEALRVVAALPVGLLTTISGPSATADIEMTRIKGVHGPRTLDVVLVGSEPR